MLINPRVTTVTALVLRAGVWREKDRLLVLLTRERGKVLAIAQGAQQPQNRLCPVAQTGVVATFWLARGRERDRVTDVRLHRVLARLRSDGVALTAFGVVAEVLERAAPAEVPDAALFDEVVGLCEVLEAGAPPHKWLVAALVRLLWRLGWMPHLLTCARCEAPVTGGEVLFAPSVGGSLCAPCAPSQSAPDGLRVAVATLQALDALLRQPRVLATLHLRPALWAQALTLLRLVWCYHLETDLSAWRVWRQWGTKGLTPVLLPHR